MKLESEEVFRVPPVMLAALPMNGNALAFRATMSLRFSKSSCWQAPQVNIQDWLLIA
jgi:hypothetical protein